MSIASRSGADGLSHDVQEAEIRSYCAKHDLQLVEVRRIVESAKNSDQRRKYYAALNWALENGCFHVLWYMHDREARNLQDVEKNEELIRKGKICIH